MPFSDVVGQKEAIAALKAMVRRSRGSGSTLIVGPEGVGRFLLACATARVVLAPDGGAAASRVASGQHADLILLDSETGIDGVRAVIESTALRPVEAERQVLILRDADRLSVEAQNALLKTLEEPPGGACVLVVAQGPEFLPETVVSRCRIVRARALTKPETKQVLTRIGVDPALAVDAEGSPGRAEYLSVQGIPEAAKEMERLILRRCEDPLGASEKLVRRRSEEKSKDQRRRLIETLRVVANRLRARLPDSEGDLRSVLEGLGSLARNANPAMVFADLALLRWKSPPTPS